MQIITVIVLEPKKTRIRTLIKKNNAFKATFKVLVHKYYTLQ